MEENREIFMPYFDLEEICKFVTYSDSTKTTESETVSNFEMEESKHVLTNKAVSERTVPSNAQIDTIRYDLVKTLMLKIIDDNIFDGEDPKNQTFTFGGQLAISTLKEFKMLKL